MMIVMMIGMTDIYEVHLYINNLSDGSTFVSVSAGMCGCEMFGERPIIPYVHTPKKIFFPTKGTKFLNDTDSVQDMHVDRCSLVVQSVQRQQQSCIFCKGHNNSSYKDILRLLLSYKDYWNNLTSFMKVERVLLIRLTELN